MKTTPDTLIAAYHATGAWGDKSLDGLFRDTAAAYPDRVAIVDAPDRVNWTGGAPRQMTYAEAELDIRRLAAFFAAIGLGPDHVIGIQAPNTVETVLALLGALRAGLIVSPLPQHWRQKNVLDALNGVGAKGLIAADRIETRQVATSARDIAAELFGLRFVFGLGKDIPDGLIELGPVIAEMGDDLPDSPLESSADRTATICWSRSGEETVPVTRCHNHWIAAASHILGAVSLPEAPSVLVPYSLSGLTGLGAGIVPWLLTGGTLHLHHPTSLSGLTKHANAVNADLVLTPGPLVQLMDKGLTSNTATIVAAWNIAAPEPAAFVPRHSIVDLHLADEYALVAKARGPSARIQATALGKHSGPNGCESRPTLLEIDITGTDLPETQPQLLVKGAMVGEVGWPTLPNRKKQPDADGYLNTGIQVQPIPGGLAGFGIPGRYAVATGDLRVIDEIYSGFPGIREAAAFLVDEPTLGARLHAALVPAHGTVPDVRAFFAYLDAEGVDLAKMPHRVLILQALPALENGSPDRERLSMRAQRLPAAVA
ncbi:hypothetical protein GCM10011316_16610 [Roseibium aquae]|uniref:AMP-dependent synthetase/ligase domain-containing protein n=1 Tax=Roseibium aquae TaxID=1323746 RepID=A0A916X0H7_9HYPH|nr:class I adenylate-forming enzyme family protein [Roseibium aquae]GGB45251.1 hypothetical protein GCM10011316_16610 [Roseibium aquae]